MGGGTIAAGLGAGAFAFFTNPVAAATTATFDISDPDTVETGDGKIEWVGLRNYRGRVDWENFTTGIEYGRSVKYLSVRGIDFSNPGVDDQEITDTGMVELDDYTDGPTDTGGDGYWVLVPEDDRVELLVAKQEGVELWDDPPGSGPATIDYDNGWTAAPEGETLAYEFTIDQEFRLFDAGQDHVTTASATEDFIVTVTNLDGETHIDVAAAADAG